MAQITAPPGEKLATKSDRQQLEAMIADLPEGILTVDLDGTLQYANRAALVMHGVDDLADLGGSVAAYCKTFRLADLTDVPLTPEGYPLARLLGGDSFTDLNVKLYVGDEDFVHEYRSLTVTDAAGEPDFFALYMTDKTEHYDAEQRFERTFAANPAPALINRLSDLRYIKVNRGFLKMTGFKREEVIGRTAYEFDVLAGVEKRHTAVERFQQGEVIAPLESYLETRSGGKKFVVVGGQPLEVGNEPCMLLTFIDLDARKKAEDTLRQSEERFSKAFRLAPVASAITNLNDGRILDVNDAFRTTTGYLSSDAIGRTTDELQLWDGGGEKITRTALKSQRGYRSLELKLKTKAGELRDVLASAETVMIGEQPCVLCMFDDVTDWKRTEAELIEAMNLVMKDPSWFSRMVAGKLMSVRGESGSSEATAKLARLTARERQVFELSCLGLSNKKIALELQLAENTVRNYVVSLYKKLAVHSKAELFVWARRHGVVG